MRYRMTALFVLVVPSFLLLAQCRTPEADNVRVAQDEFLRLSISDELREATGLWKDPIHWRVVIIEPEVASSAYWKGIPAETGKKTIVVFLDHPNGVDRAPFRVTYPMLEQTAKSAVDRVLKRHGWQERYVSHSSYVQR